MLSHNIDITGIVDSIAVFLVQASDTPATEPHLGTLYIAQQCQHTGVSLVISPMVKRIRHNLNVVNAQG